MPEATLLSQPFAGLHAQILGLAEAAALTPTLLPIAAPAPWRWIAPRLWPSPLAAISSPLPQGLVLGIGGAGAAVGAALRRRGATVVQVQAPRLPLARFDCVVVNRHDRIAGPNVITTRTALHRVTPVRLAEAREAWLPRLAHLPRPLLAVLVGGSNGRFRLERAEGEALAGSLVALMRRDGAGVAVTPSRRTAPAVRAALERELRPLGACVWDMAGENPYLGLLACADAILVTADSVSMVSEAAATAAPVLVAALPGRSRRIGGFLEGLTREGRVRPFTGRLETWDTAPLDDTAAAAAELRHRLRL